MVLVWTHNTGTHSMVSEITLFAPSHLQTSQLAQIARYEEILLMPAGEKRDEP